MTGVKRVYAARSPAKATGGADEAGHNAHAIGEALGHELKHGTIAHPQHSHPGNDKAYGQPYVMVTYVFLAEK